MYKMLFVEFPVDLKYGPNVLKYREVDGEDWYYLYADIEIITILITNFGIISTKKIPMVYTCCDNLTTSKDIKLQYCGADLEISCGNKSRFNLAKIEQNY